ncbi:MAG: FAD-binding oxidoreductase, partial [Actinomycetota bacterium]|nr:FAD-binding oxidoreductase [Actinomycetota bacterium]
MPDNDSRVSLSGWGGTAPSVGELRTMSADAGRVAATIKDAPRRGVITRGLGRSYGDSAQNGGGLVLRLAAGADDVVLDTVTATARAAAGLSIDDLLRFVVPRGYFVPVTPGTRFVTVGGAIASDIHGKNHHVEGSFGSHVRRLSLLTADGTTRELSPDGDDPAAFWATVGGMGLTGVILDATFSLIPIETSRCVVETRRVPDLDALFALMSSGDDAVRYSVAWIDLLAKGAHLGRSVLTTGDHATVDELAPKHRGSPLAYGPRQFADVPVVPPISALNHASVAVFNELWYRRAPTHRDGEIQEIGRFFHPLDAVRRWNRLYGPKGFVQYQFVVPFGQEDAMRTVIERLATSGTASFLAVLKQFGPANPAPLSFPFPGWTLALDIPAARKGLAALLHGLDDVVLGAGGRHYLAKDAHMSKA